MLVLAFAAAAVPAGAVVVEAEGVGVGLQPRSTGLLDGLVQAKPKPGETPEPNNFANPAGSPVVPASRVYAVYWDPVNRYHGDWQGLIDGFLQGAAAASGSFNLFATDAQYTDGANQHASYDTAFMGAYTDTEPYPAPTCTDPQPLEGNGTPSGEPDAVTCLTDQQIRSELARFIARHTLQTGMESIFYVLTPPGVTVCLNGGGVSGHCSDYASASSESYEDSFCSYHSYINPDNAPGGDASTVLYAAIPWTAGGLGDYHLAAADRTPALDCQDGGYNPASKPIEEPEAPAEAPHQQEPNQAEGGGPGRDGTPDRGLADLIINQISVEQQNTITDPLLNAWQDPARNEATDECRDFFSAAEIGGSVTLVEGPEAGTLYNQAIGEHHYYLNDAFNLSALKLQYPAVPCVPGIVLEPKFTAPSPVKTGEIVGFDGMESDVTLNWGTEFAPTETKPTYAYYSWNFGDGSPEVSGYAPGGPPVNPPVAVCEQPWRAPCAASVFHSYQYGGTYQVTLTVKDTGGNTASTVQSVVVLGSPPPGSPGGPGGEVPSASPGASPGATPGAAPPATTGGSPGPAHPAAPGPVAAAAAVSSSLGQVAKHGLVVKYSVNEQVAGRFEVLLPRSVAHALKIGGHLASGLPAGYPQSLVIGQALLVTTKGGHSTVRIKFSRRTAKRLRHAHKTVTLTLRLKVRNASQSPLFTTVLSSVVLHR